MWSLVSEIELYIKSLLRENSRGWIELSRKELAERFECVPSQITYVVNTRFTTDHGYYVESRRGGGGFIRICLLGAKPRQEERSAGQQSHTESGEGRSLEGVPENFQEVLFNLTRRGILTDREFTMLCKVFKAMETNISGGDLDPLCLRILKEILSSSEYWEI